jgi:phosphoserine phosphatase RsbU/P
MTRLNRDLAATGCSNVRFATAVCGTLNVQTREVQLAGAGHPPPLILGEGATRKVTAGGPLLGVMDDSVYEQAVFTLGEGETLILYSDGLEDSLNPRHPGEDQESASRTRHIEFLEGVSREVGGPDPEKMFARFAQIMDTESGSMHQVDDVTLVGVRVASRA